MKKMKKIGMFGIILSTLFLTSSCMMIMPMHSGGMMHHNNKQESIYYDPVCGTETNSTDAISYTYNESVYYFESNECLDVFQNNPDHFVSSNKDKKTWFKSAATITGGSLFMLGMMALMII